jgi:hypothetical protein
MTAFKKVNQSIGHYIGKKVSPRARLKQQVSSLFKHLSVLPKSTQHLGDSYGPPDSRNDKGYSVRARA